VAATIIFVHSAEAVRVTMHRGQPLADLLERPCARCGHTLLIARDALETYTREDGPGVLIACEDCYRRLTGKELPCWTPPGFS
jgi:hypothetical protein